MKLFSSSDFTSTPTVESLISSDTTSLLSEINDECLQFTYIQKQYNKLNTLNNTMVQENYTLINKNNAEFFNNYIQEIASNLNMTNVPIISSTSFENREEVFVNRSIALEGFLGNIWAKIKAIFASIVEKVKQFFKRFFTRIGRLKGRTENLLKVLEETKNLQPASASVDNVPSNITKFYPTENIVLANTVDENLNSCLKIIDFINKISGEASKVAANKIIPSATIEKLKQAITDSKVHAERVKTASKTVEDSKATGPFGSLKDALSPSDALKEAKKELSSATKDAAGTELEKENIGKSIDKAAKDLPDLEDDATTDKATSHIEEGVKVLNELITKFSVDLKNDVLPKGKRIVMKEVKDTEDLELFEIVDIDTDGKVESLGIAPRDSLIKLNKKSLALINSLETSNTSIQKVLDDFSKLIVDIDKTVVLIDKLGDDTSESLKKYKTFSSKVIRPKLNKFKQVFVGYNKILTNLKDISLDACEGTINFSVFCLKHSKG